MTENNIKSMSHNWRMGWVSTRAKTRMTFTDPKLQEIKLKKKKEPQIDIIRKKSGITELGKDTFRYSSIHNLA